MFDWALWSFSWLLYATCLFKIVRKSKTKFSSSYFTVCMSLGAADLLNALNDRVFTLRRSVPWFFELSHILSPPLAYVNLFNGWFFLYAQTLGLVLLTINRYTAVSKPLQFDLIWMQQRTRRFIMIQWFLAFVASSPMLYVYRGAYYVRQDNDSLVVLVVQKPVLLKLFYGVMLLYMVIVSSVLACFYILSFRTYLSHQAQVLPSSETSDHQKTCDMEFRVESRLALAGFSIFLTYLFMTIVAFVLALTGNINKYFVYYSLARDICSLSNPYVYLIFSPALRKEFFWSKSWFVKVSIEVGHQGQGPSPRAHEPSRQIDMRVQDVSGD